MSVQIYVHMSNPLHPAVISLLLSVTCVGVAWEKVLENTKGFGMGGDGKKIC